MFTTFTNLIVKRKIIMTEKNAHKFKLSSESKSFTKSLSFVVIVVFVIVTVSHTANISLFDWRTAAWTVNNI